MSWNFNSCLLKVRTNLKLDNCINCYLCIRTGIFQPMANFKFSDQIYEEFFNFEKLNQVYMLISL